MMTDFPNKNDRSEDAPGRLRRLGLPVLAVAGAVTAASFFAPVGLASAQDEDSDTTSEEDSETESTDSDSDSASDSDSEGRRLHRHSGARALSGMRGLGDAVTNTLGVTGDELRQAMQDGKSLADVAEEQGVAVSDLTAAITEATEARLDEAVAEGKIDEERADNMSAQLSERVDQMMTATVDDLGKRHKSAHRAAHRGADRGEHTEELAEFFGLSVDELQESRTEGQTLAELAEAQGIAEDDLVAFILNGLQERVDEAVAEGRVDADEAAERMADAESRIAEKVNAEPGDKSTRSRRSGKGRHGNNHEGGHADSAWKVTGEGVQGTSA